VRLVDVHEGNLRVIFRHFPLTTIHDKATITSEATEAAGAQGAFWEMHDLIFERMQEWAGLSIEDLPEVLSGYAAELGLDVDQFSSDLENGTYRDKVDAQRQDAIDMQLRGTPTIIVNGKLFPSDQWGLSYQAIDAFIRLVALEPRQYTSPPPQVTDPSNEYMATIRTERGDMVVELYADQAPANVNSFVFLAQEGWYDGITFFRVIPDFVAQTGDPTNTAAGNPGYQCQDEISADLSFDDVGVIGIANAGPDTGSSQIFITLAPQPTLDGGYTIIGKVVEGLDVLQSISPHDPNDMEAPPGDLIETIIIEER
jgi:cyclophilin family peptidyl-prolyl cis-trans isomerase